MVGLGHWPPPPDHYGEGEESLLDGERCCKRRGGYEEGASRQSCELSLREVLGFACAPIAGVNYASQNPLVGDVWSGRVTERFLCGIWRVIWSRRLFVAHTHCHHSSAGLPPWPRPALDPLFLVPPLASLTLGPGMCSAP